MGSVETEEKELYKAIENLTAAVEDWLRILKDPFKPPELKIGWPKDIASASFHTAVQWYVLNELAKREENNG